MGGGETFLKERSGFANYESGFGDSEDFLDERFDGFEKILEERNVRSDKWGDDGLGCTKDFLD